MPTAVLYSPLPDVCLDYLHNRVVAEQGCVERQMVIVGPSPVPSGEVIVEFLTFPVEPASHLAPLFDRVDLTTLHQIASPVLDRSVQKDAHQTRMMAEDIVGRAADEYASALFGQFLYHTALSLID